MLYLKQLLLLPCFYISLLGVGKYFDFSIKFDRKKLF